MPTKKRLNKVAGNLNEKAFLRIIIIISAKKPLQFCFKCIIMDWIKICILKLSAPLEKNLMEILKNILIIFVATTLYACGDADVDSASGDNAAADATPVELSNEAPAVTFTPEKDAAGKPRGPVTVEPPLPGPMVGTL